MRSNGEDARRRLQMRPSRLPGSRDVSFRERPIRGERGVGVPIEPEYFARYINSLDADKMHSRFRKSSSGWLPTATGLNLGRRVSSVNSLALGLDRAAYKSFRSHTYKNAVGRGAGRQHCFPNQNGSARFLARDFGALLPCLGEADCDRLFPALHAPAFAALTRSQRTAFPASHRRSY